MRKLDMSTGFAQAGRPFHKGVKEKRMTSYLVKVYQFDRGSEHMAGVIQQVNSDKKIAFSRLADLWEIIAASEYFKHND